MDILEIQKEKQRVEKAILDLITLFSKETSLTIDDIKIRKIDVTTVSDDRIKTVYGMPEIYVRL